MNTRQSTIMDRLDAGVRNRLPAIVANLVSYGNENNGVAQVVVVANRQGTKAQMVDAVTATLKGAATPIPNTFQSVLSNGAPAFVGYVRCNKTTRIADEKEVAKLTVMAGNLLLDAEDDSLWAVREDTHGGKVLERQGQDSLSKLLETAKVHVARAPSVENVVSSAVAPKDYACFIDPVTSNLRFGIVLSVKNGSTPELHTNPDNGGQSDEGGETHDSPAEPLVVPESEVELLPVASDEPLTIKSSMIVMAAELDGSEKVPNVVPPREGSGKARMLEYYARLYRYNPPYFRQLEAIIQGNMSF